MNLVASLIVRNELSRYLRWTLPALLDFCDEVRILDDGSDEPGWPHDLNGIPGGERVLVKRVEETQFFRHEGRARNALLDWTFAANPTHVLAIDADEFVADGQRVRDAIETGWPVYTLSMEEVWKAEHDCLCVRQDGAWGPHEAPIVYAVPPANQRNHTWRINDRRLACGREPVAVRNLRRQARQVDTEILHFGWANEQERAARHARYQENDGGRFHRDAHLQSIMWGDDRVSLFGRPWPASLLPVRDAIVERANRKLQPA